MSRPYCSICHVALGAGQSCEHITIQESADEVSILKSTISKLREEKKRIFAAADRLLDAIGHHECIGLGYSEEFKNAEDGLAAILNESEKK